MAHEKVTLISLTAARLYRHLRFVWLPAILLILVLAACSSGNGDPATPAPPADTPASTTGSSAPEPSPAAGSAVNDLNDLPDDPRALMLATLNRPLSRVALKMANSGNKAFIPVLLEFMRFQPLEEGSTAVESFMSRIKDNVPLDEDVVFPQDLGPVDGMAGLAPWNTATRRACRLEGPTI